MMLSPRLTNCTECIDVLGLIERIDCSIAQRALCTYNTIIYGFKGSCDNGVIMDLLNYRRILTNKYYNPEYVGKFSLESISSRVIILTPEYVKKIEYPFTPEETTTTTTSTTIAPVTTTTTTTLSCISWIYNVTLYLCSDCSQTGGGTINNFEPLTIGKWYNYNGFKIQIDSLITCSLGAPVENILNSSGTNTCEELVCPTVLTEFNISSNVVLCCPEGPGYQTINTVAYHNGSGALPDVGDICYSDALGTLPLEGTELSYAYTIDGPAWLCIGIFGVVTSLASLVCVGCR